MKYYIPLAVSLWGTAFKGKPGTPAQSIEPHIEWGASIGFVPVYETREAAEAEYPHHQIIEVESVAQEDA